MTVEHDCVVVTGASRGIGLAIASRLIREGRTVIGVARDRSRLEAVERRLGERFTPVSCDLAAERDFDALVSRLSVDGVVPSALVAAAGIAEYAAAVDVSMDSMRRHLDVHVVATHGLATALARRWIALGVAGSVVAVTSTLSSKPAPFTLPYATAKAALDALVRGLALELAPHRIRVNSVAPGVVDTDMVRAPRPDESDPDARLQALANFHPLGRLGHADEVASTVVHVLDAEFMTGSRVVIDGGLSLV